MESKHYSGLNDAEVMESRKQVLRIGACLRWLKKSNHLNPNNEFPKN